MVKFVVETLKKIPNLIDSVFTENLFSLQENKFYFMFELNYKKYFLHKISS